MQPCGLEQVWILDSESGKRIRRQALQMLGSLFRLSMIPFGKAGAGQRTDSQALVRPRLLASGSTWSSTGAPGMSCAPECQAKASSESGRLPPNRLGSALLREERGILVSNGLMREGHGAREHLSFKLLLDLGRQWR